MTCVLTDGHLPAGWKSTRGRRRAARCCGMQRVVRLPAIRGPPFGPRNRKASSIVDVGQAQVTGGSPRRCRGVAHSATIRPFLSCAAPDIQLRRQRLRVVSVARLVPDAGSATGALKMNSVLHVVLARLLAAAGWSSTGPSSPAPRACSMVDRHLLAPRNASRLKSDRVAGGENDRIRLDKADRWSSCDTVVAGLRGRVGPRYRER